MLLGSHVGQPKWGIGLCAILCLKSHRSGPGTLKVFGWLACPHRALLALGPVWSLYLWTKEPPPEFPTPKLEKWNIGFCQLVLPWGFCHLYSVNGQLQVVVLVFCWLWVCEDLSVCHLGEHLVIPPSLLTFCKCPATSCQDVIQSALRFSTLFAGWFFFFVPTGVGNRSAAACRRRDNLPWSVVQSSFQDSDCLHAWSHCIHCPWLRMPNCFYVAVLLCCLLDTLQHQFSHAFSWLCSISWHCNYQALTVLGRPTL